MILYVLSIIDSEAKQYGPLHLVKSLAVGKRMFMETLANPQGDSMIQKYPESFMLMQVGCFDDESGELIPEDVKPCVVITAKEAIRLLNAPKLDPDYSEETIDMFNPNGEVAVNG